MSTAPTVAVDPAELGFDPTRLDRIPAHFARYVDEGLLPGFSALVTRGGEVVHTSVYGSRDLESGAPMELDTIVRIYSMTKPIVSVLAMTLVEEGRMELTDPVHRYIPAFRDSRVFRSGSATNPTTEGLAAPMRVWHLMTHTSGLTYGFLHAHPTDARYRARGFEWGVPKGMDLAEVCDVLASEPLAFQPGAEWNYSMATDVLGRVCEVVGGAPLDQLLSERVLGPLGMTDTGFFSPESEHDRTAALYVPNPADGGKAVRSDAMGKGALKPPTFLGGGGGLVSTLGDYHRFTQMLARGGELDGTRILGSRTLEYMIENHLPGNADLTAYGRPLFAETAFDGQGFGLGFSVVMRPAEVKSLCSAGEFSWGGAASTAFWVDPVEEITVIFLTQLLPSSTYPIRTELRNLVYSSLVD